MPVVRMCGLSESPRVRIHFAQFELGLPKRPDDVQDVQRPAPLCRLNLLQRPNPFIPRTDLPRRVCLSARDNWNPRVSRNRVQQKYCNPPSLPGSPSVPTVSAFQSPTAEMQNAESKSRSPPANPPSRNAARTNSEFGPRESPSPSTNTRSPQFAPQESAIAISVGTQPNSWRTCSQRLECWQASLSGAEFHSSGNTDYPIPTPRLQSALVENCWCIP